MEARELLDIVTVAERLKDTTRHCYTSKGRRESVAEHTFMITLMSFLIQDEFPEADVNKIMSMCIIHDLGEAFTGDIPVFEKTCADEDKEKSLLNEWLGSISEPTRGRMKELFFEMEEQKTLEAKIYKALDKLEALIQHNLSDLSTWIPGEYNLQKVYAHENVEFSDYMKKLRAEILQDTLEKIGEKE